MGFISSVFRKCISYGDSEGEGEDGSEDGGECGGEYGGAAAAAAGLGGGCAGEKLRSQGYPYQRNPSESIGKTRRCGLLRGPFSRLFILFWPKFWSFLMQKKIQNFSKIITKNGTCQQILKLQKS